MNHRDDLHELDDLQVELDRLADHAHERRSTCHGCGIAVSPSRGSRPRKWCSDRCRRKTLYATPCVDCGTLDSGSNGHPRRVPHRCAGCYRANLAEEQNARARTQITETIDDAVVVPLINAPGRFALIDECDSDIVLPLRWRLTKYDYVYTCAGGDRMLRLHRLVLGRKAGDGIEVDHINRDKLDNRRSNLRLASRATNMQNVESRPGATSRFRGVCRVRDKWSANARLNGRSHYLGLFASELEAAVVADRWRLEHMPYAQSDELLAQILAEAA